MWDKVKMAQKFLQQANAIYPEETQGDTQFADALARQDVYYDCYMSSFSREDLIKRLKQAVAGDFQVPEEREIDEGTYREAYVREMELILIALERGEM